MSFEMGDRVTVTGGKYDGHTGVIEKVCSKACTLVLSDGKMTGNLKHGTLRPIDSASTAAAPAGELTYADPITPPASSRSISRKGDAGTPPTMPGGHVAADMRAVLVGTHEAAGAKFECDGKQADRIAAKLKLTVDTIIKIFDGKEINKFLERGAEGATPADRAVTTAPGVPAKVVVFSFFTTVLDAFEHLLRSNDLPFLRIDGKKSNIYRKEAIESFKAPDSPRVMLVSVEAGGAGINLQSANVAILLDPWWNPTKERQAQDRVWRLNSPHDAIYFYNFFTAGSIDEKFQEVKDKKEMLYDQTIRRIEDTVTWAVLHDLGTPFSAEQCAVSLEKRLSAVGFCGTPKSHQVLGISWMHRQEYGENPMARGTRGGILADDMGLGKTFQTLAAIALDKRSWEKPTLIVCPLTAFDSWQRDAATFMPTMRVHTWHGTQEARWNAERLTSESAAPEGKGPLLVLTNYHHLRDKATEGLNGTSWLRLVLDESQFINNRNFGFDNACGLDAEIKWSVSGTPVTNNLEDFTQHLRLIGSRLRAEDMKTDALHGIALRRTKLGVKQDGEKLPSCFVSADWLHMSPEETTRYKTYIAGKKGFAKFTGGRQKTAIASLGEPWAHEPASAGCATEYRNPDRERDRHMWMWYKTRCPTCNEVWPEWAVTVSAKETALSQCRTGHKSCRNRPEFQDVRRGQRYLNPHTKGLTPSQQATERAWSQGKLIAIHPSKGEQFFTPIHAADGSFTGGKHSCE